MDGSVVAEARAVKEAKAERLSSCLGSLNNKGIHYCSDVRRDESRVGRSFNAAQSCGFISDADGAQDILSLKGELRISLTCQPRVKEYRQGKKRINSDYLKASSQPYLVKTRAVKGSDRQALLPELSQHSSICQPDY